MVRSTMREMTASRAAFWPSPLTPMARSRAFMASHVPFSMALSACWTTAGAGGSSSPGSGGPDGAAAATGAALGACWAGGGAAAGAASAGRVAARWTVRVDAGLSVACSSLISSTERLRPLSASCAIRRHTVLAARAQSIACGSVRYFAFRSHPARRAWSIVTVTRSACSTP